MKALIYIIIVYIALSFAQEENPQYPTAELGCQTTHFGANQTIKFVIEPLGSIYCTDLNNDCNLLISSPIQTDFEVIFSGNSYTDPQTGFQILSHCGVDPINIDLDKGWIFHGLFEVNIYVDGENTTTFFFDNRDDSFVVSRCNNPGNCNGNDITLRLVNTQNGPKLWINKNGITGDYSREQPGWISLEEFGPVLTFWELKDCTSKNMENFPIRPFSILNIIEDNDHPYLTWTQPKNYQHDVDYYSVELAHESNFTQIGTTSDNYYTDLSKLWSQHDDPEYFRYRIVTRFKNGALMNIQIFLNLKGANLSWKKLNALVEVLS